MFTQYMNQFFHNFDQRKAIASLQKVISSKEGAISIATALIVMAGVSAYNANKFDRGCPRVPDSSLIYGSTDEYIKDPEAFIEKWQNELGDVYSAFLFGEETVVLSGYQVREVFLNDKFHFLSAISRTFDNFLLTNSVFTLGKDSDRIIDLIKRYLNPNLQHYTPRVIENLSIAFKDYIGNIPAEGKEFDHVFPMVQHMIARATASVFVGNKLVENEQLVDAFKNMVLEVASEITRKPFLEIFPRLVKARMWIIGKTSEKVRKVRTKLYNALKSEIDSRFNGMELEGSNWERPEDILQSIIEDGKRPENMDIYTYCAENITQLIFAAIHTTSENSTISLYRIMSHPGLVDELLEEQNQVLKDEGLDENCGPEVFTREILNKFVKLDSAIRESFRCRNDNISLPHKNISNESIILSNGVTIRPGESVYINMFSNHYNTDIQKALDDIREYSPLRFVDSGKNSTKIGDDFLLFGMGRHACPGRWFAVQEIKTLISYIIRQYEVIPLEEITFPKGDRFFFPMGKFKLVPRK
ncbi:unnamed protein product [Cunninghamella blakesleeana]